MYTLTVVDFSSPGSEAAPAKHPITKDYITIGRGKENDIVVIQGDISKRHAALRVTAQGVYLEDLGSTNGTVLNDLPVTSPVRVYEDDHIHVGLARITLGDSPLLRRGGGSAPPRNGADPAEPFFLDEDGAPPAHAPASLPSIPDIPQVPDLSQGTPGSDAGSPFPFLESENLSSAGLSSGRPSFPFDIPDEPRVPSPQAGASSLVEKIRRIESEAIKSRPPVNKPSTDLVDKIKDIESKALSRPPAPAAKAASPQRTICAAPVPTETAIIVAVSVPDQGPKACELIKRSIIIGRAPESDLCLSQPLVSSRHAILEVGASDQLVLRDLGSTNGTFVNHAQITSPTIVGPDDEIFIGDCRLLASVGQVPVREQPDEPPQDLATQAAPVPTVTPPPAQEQAQEQAQTQAPAQAPSLAPAAPQVPAPDPAQGAPAFGLLDAQVLLATARKALGATLERVQSRPEPSAKTRRLCTGMAQAAAALYRAQKAAHDFDVIRAAADEAAGHIKASLAALKEDKTFTEADDQLIRALSLLYPLTSENFSHPDGPSPPWSGVRSGAGPRTLVRRRLDEAHQDPQMKDNVLIAHAVFRADKKYLATARKMARSIAYNYYLDDQQTLRLENVIDEACSNVIDHAFADSQQGAFAVSLYTDPNDEQLIINIDDRGLPFDTEKADSGHMDGMGMTLMRAFCKKVRVLSRGRLGKRVQLEMDLPGSMSGFFSTFEGAEKSKSPQAPLSLRAALKICLTNGPRRSLGASFALVGTITTTTTSTTSRSCGAKCKMTHGWRWSPWVETRSRWGTPRPFCPSPALR